MCWRGIRITTSRCDTPVGRRRDYTVVGPQHGFHFVFFLVKIVVFEQFVNFEQLVSRIRKSEELVNEPRKTRILGHGLHCALQLRDTTPERRKLVVAFVEQTCGFGGILLSFGKNLVQCQKMRRLNFEQLFSQLSMATFLGLLGRESELLEQIHQLLENGLEWFRFSRLFVSEKLDDIFR